MDQEPNQPTNQVPPAAEPAPLQTPPPPAAPPQPQPGFAPQPPKAEADSPNQLAALMLTSTFGVFGIHQLYIGNKTQGWVRFALGVASFPLTLVFIGGITFLVLSVWAVVDFVRIGFGMATDNAGNKLAGTQRDVHWSKVLTIISLVVLLLYGLIIALIIGFGALNFMNSGTGTGNSADPIWLDSRSY